MLKVLVVVAAFIIVVAIFGAILGSRRHMKSRVGRIDDLWLTDSGVRDVVLERFNAVSRINDMLKKLVENTNVDEATAKQVAEIVSLGYRVQNACSRSVMQDITKDNSAVSRNLAIGHAVESNLLLMAMMKKLFTVMDEELYEYLTPKTISGLESMLKKNVDDYDKAKNKYNNEVYAFNDFINHSFYKVFAKLYGIHPTQVVGETVNYVDELDPFDTTPQIEVEEDGSEVGSGSTNQDGASDDE